MKKDTIRLIITFKCNRSCAGCCNKDKEIMAPLVTVSSLNFPKKFKSVCITGGEPMLDPVRTLMIIKKIRFHRPNIKIFLYTALWGSYLHKIIEHIDGVQFSLHAEAKAYEMYDFREFQKLVAVWYKRDKSFRVFIDNRLKLCVKYIAPWIYSRFEIKPWLDKCPVPKNEVLWYYREKEGG